MFSTLEYLLAESLYLSSWAAKATTVSSLASYPVIAVVLPVFFVNSPLIIKSFIASFETVTLYPSSVAVGKNIFA